MTTPNPRTVTITILDSTSGLSLTNTIHLGQGEPLNLSRVSDATEELESLLNIANHARKIALPAVQKNLRRAPVPH